MTSVDAIYISMLKSLKIIFCLVTLSLLYVLTTPDVPHSASNAGQNITHKSVSQSFFAKFSTYHKTACASLNDLSNLQFKITAFALQILPSLLYKEHIYFEWQKQGLYFDTVVWYLFFYSAWGDQWLTEQAKEGSSVAFQQALLTATSSCTLER